MLLGKLITAESEAAAIRGLLRGAVISTCLFTSGLQAQGQVDYLTQVEPVFKERCGCHLGTAESGIELTSYSTLMTSIGLQYQQQPITPFEPGQSPLFDVISNNPPRFGRSMPPFGAPLTTARIGLLRTWISQGGGEGFIAPRISARRHQ